MTYVTSDSGARQEYASGMHRDVQDGKPDYTLLPIPMLTRWAELMTRGAVKYSARNWEKADSQEELDRFKASAFRHFVQWLNGEGDVTNGQAEEREDHAAAVLFNIAAAEYVKARLSAVLHRQEDGHFPHPPSTADAYTDGSRGTYPYLVREDGDADAWQWVRSVHQILSPLGESWASASNAADRDTLTEVSM